MHYEENHLNLRLHNLIVESSTYLTSLHGMRSEPAQDLQSVPLEHVEQLDLWDAQIIVIGVRLQATLGGSLGPLGLVSWLRHIEIMVVLERV